MPNWRQILEDYVDALETRLTAVRAGYLDELGPTNIPADIDTLLTRLSAARAGYLDELDFDLNARLGSPAGASLAADLVTIAAYVDALETRLTAVRAGYLDELGPTNLPADIDTLLTRLSAVRAGYLDELAAANLPTDVANLAADLGDASASTLGSILAILGNPAQTFLAMIGYEGAATLADKLTAARAALLDQITAARMQELDGANLPADIDTLLTRLSAARAGYLDNIAATAAGRAQMKATTIDLNQAAATYDLLTGTAQAVILESLNFKCPTGAAGGALTSISIQTDDATPAVIINSTDGAVANLTSEAELSWYGSMYIAVGTKIRLTIGGGAHGAGYVCDVVAKSRAVVAGGSLA